jgi:hypothetical protein
MIFAISRQNGHGNCEKSEKSENNNVTRARNSSGNSLNGPHFGCWETWMGGWVDGWRQAMEMDGRH